MEGEIKSIIHGVCSALHATAEIKYTRSYPAVINHVQETEFFRKVAINDVGADKVLEAPILLGSEDFSYYLQHVPGMFYFTGAAMEDPELVFPHHHPRFDFDERAMLIAGKTLLSLVINYLNQKDHPYGLDQTPLREVNS